MIEIDLLRRLLGQDRSGETRLEAAPLQVLRPLPPEQAPAALPLVTAVACPNCGILLDPPPTSTRLCPRCRRRIVVRHVEGRAIYLTEAAVEVFEAERQRTAMHQTWTRQRRDWLQLGRLVGAPVDRRQRLADAPLSEAVVHSARTLYLVTVERSVRVARRDKHWEDVARLRRRQAQALFEEDGGTPPPSDEVVAVYREGIAATLRELATVARQAELVGSACCATCRADDERIYKIADELRTPRLPHPGCPRGLCACDWWPAVQMPASKRRRRRTAATAPAPAGDPEATGTPADEPPDPFDDT